MKEDIQKERWVVVRWSNFHNDKITVDRFEDAFQARDFLEEISQDWTAGSACMTERYYMSHWMEEHPHLWDALKKEVGL